MRRLVVLAVGLSLIATMAVIATPILAANPSSRPLLAGSSFDGVSGIFVGSANPLRGIPGGGFPWVISEGHFQLRANGELEVEVEGLVIDPSNASAQAKGIAGVNPLHFFLATLSCEDNAGATTNVNTSAFPATATGIATIEQAILLPATCFAPLVFVRGSANGASSGPWFAVSGF